MRRLSLIIVSILLLGSLSNAMALTTPKAGPIPFNATVKHYIQQVQQRYHLQPQRTAALLRQANYEPGVIKKITRPFESKPWNYYRHFFITPHRIQGGVAFWHHHAKTLRAVARQYHVDPSVIVAIIGVETLYGKHTYQYNEISALATLAFFYPPRAKFFRSELTQYLLLTKEQKLDAIKLRGSYAGALGIPQFMPSSYRRYGVNYTNKHSVNLLSDPQDAIASVANYLKKSGWQAGKPIATRAQIHGKPQQALVSATATPSHRVAYYAKRGISASSALPKTASQLPAALIEMHNAHSQEYWLVFPNFKAIMKYNPRTTYALAVFQLSRHIKQAYEQQYSR